MEKHASTGQAGALTEDRENAQHERGHLVLQFGDLGCEANQVRLIEAMILNHVLPGDAQNANGLEAAIFKLQRRTVNDLMATRTKLFEAHRQSAAILLERFQDQYVAKGDLQTGDPVF